MTLEVQCEVAMTGDPWAPAAGDWVRLNKVLDVDTSTGRQQELGRVEPGEATVIIFDPTRDLDPHKPTGPYVDELDEQRPIRLKVADPATGYGPVDLWRGFLGSVEPWTDGYAEHTARLRAVDPLGVAGLPGIMPRTGLDAYAQANAPETYPSALAEPQDGRNRFSAWYKLDDPTATLTDNPWDSSYMERHGWGFYADPKGPSLAGDPYSWSASFDGTTGWLYLPDTVGLQKAFTIGFWVQCPPKSGTNRRTILAQYGLISGSYYIGLHVTIGSAGNTGPGEIQVALDGPSLSAVYNRATQGGTQKRVDDNAPHFVVISYHISAAGYGQYLLEVDGEVSMLHTTSSAVAGDLFGGGVADGTGYTLVGAQSGFAGGSGFDGYLEDLFLLNGATTTSPTQLSRAGVGQVFGNEYTDDRARLVLNTLMGWPAALTDVPARADAQWADLLMPHTIYGLGTTTALSLLLEAAAAEDGELVATRAGLIKLIGATGRPAGVSATWDDGSTGTGGALPYEDVEIDRSKVLNRIAVARSGAWTVEPGPAAVAQDVASITRFRTRPLELALSILNDAVRQTRADALLARYKLPATRVTSMTLAPQHSTAVRDALFAANLHDLWRVLHKPVGGGYTIDKNLRLVGLRHRMTRQRWRSDAFLAPY